MLFLLTLKRHLLEGDEMVGNKKIKEFDELAKILADLKAENQKIVLCHGCFDLLHIGHIRYLEQAKTMGEILVVTVTPDRYVDRGPHVPTFSEDLRVESVASLSCVDYAALNKWPTAIEMLRLLRPDVYVKGSEFREVTSDSTGKIGEEVKVVREFGGQILFTEDIVFSSTNMINRYLSKFPEEVNEYLRFFRGRYCVDIILEILDKMASSKVLVIGDIILDEYQYCASIGTSSKDPILALRYLSKDMFAGGVLSVANHLANFSENVQLATVLGGKDSQENFVRSKLHENIKPYFLINPEASTVIKRRFVDGYSLNKLFEIYVMDYADLQSDKENEFCAWLEESLPKYDLVIVADYGHGAISPGMLKTLVEHSPFLAVNTQANAGNRGFNTISRYARADYACLAEHEIRLEMRRLNGDLHPMMNSVADSLKCRQLVVTRGKKGCIVRSAEGRFVEAPAFAHKVLDRIGAGDAFFSVTSLAALQGVPDEILGFIGNVTGSLAVEILGNQEAVHKAALRDCVVSVLK
jgi:rfaE bifunctional protein kinase chain/domain/rfaE bifunctional protein nucleotidyltransferase chain/domain